MQLICETFESDLTYSVQEIVNESGVKEKNYYIRGKFTTIGEKNRNGRTYSRALWESNIAEYQDVIKFNKNESAMELSHPPRTKVDIMEAVAKITKLEIDGKYVVGEAVILNNNDKKTNQLKALIDAGYKIDVSSRGVGKVGAGGIVESFKLITYDIVPEGASDYAASLDGVRESFENGILINESFDITESGDIVCSLENPEACKCQLKETMSESFYKETVKDVFSDFFGNLEGELELKSLLTLDEKQKTDLDPAIKVLDYVIAKTDFEFYNGVNTPKGYLLEINTKEKKTGIDIKITIRFDFQGGYSIISVDGGRIKGNKKFQISSLRNGTIDFAKKFAKMTGNNEDYDIIVGPLNRVNFPGDMKRVNF